MVSFIFTVSFAVFHAGSVAGMVMEMRGPPEREERVYMVASTFSAMLVTFWLGAIFSHSFQAAQLLGLGAFATRIWVALTLITAPGSMSYNRAALESLAVVCTLALAITPNLF